MSDRPEATAAAGSTSRLAARPLRSLHDSTRSFVAAWRESFATGWSADAAVTLNEEIERIASQADEMGVRAIADPALEFVVYLCSFVEAASQPTASQRVRLEALVEALDTAVGAVPPRPLATVTPIRGRVRQVLYLREPAREIAGLASQLGQHGYVVRPCDSLEHARQALAEQHPDAIVVDEALVEALASFSELLDGERGEPRARPVCLVIGSTIEPARQLFARRTGADGVLEARDAVQVATRVDELIGAQRSLDYRVLIVEDDRQQAMFCEAILRHRGIASRVVSHPDDVLPILAAFKPDLMLLDLYLPDRNGIEVAQLVREHSEYAFLPIVFFSGEQDLDRRFDAIRMGGDDFINKPVRPRHLLAAVESRIRRARLLPAREQRAGGDRRGALAGRAAFAEAMTRAQGESEREAIALVLVQVDADTPLLERVGFINTGTVLQQLGASLAAEGPVLHPVCAMGDGAFLALARAESEGMLRQRLTQVHARLESRRWLGTADPLQLALRLTALKLKPGVDSVDELIARVRSAAENARRDGSARFAFDAGRADEGGNEDPVRRLARTLVRGPLPREAISLQRQALISLRGELGEQHALRIDVVPPKASRPIVMSPEIYLGAAREVGLVVAAERECLRVAMRQAAALLGQNADSRLHVDVSAESALDAAFAPWIAAELRRYGIAPARLVVTLDVASLLPPQPTLRGALDALQVAGVRLCLAGVEGLAADTRLAKLPSFDAIKVRAPEGEATAGAWTAQRGNVIAQSLRHGKVVLVSGAIATNDLPELLKLGVHYVQSDTLSLWAPAQNA